MAEKSDNPPTYGQIKRLAGRWGVLRTGHLLNAGLSADGITWRVKKRRLYRMYQGVYSVIPPEHLRIQGRWLAAVYAYGEGAGLSHLAAAAHWDIAPIPGAPIDVTVPGTSGRIRRPGIRIHRSQSLTAADITVHEGIPVTTPARTLRDLHEACPTSHSSLS